MPMLTYSEGLEAYISVRVFIYIHTLCMGAASVLASLCNWTSSAELLLLDNAIIIKIWCAGSNG